MQFLNIVKSVCNKLYEIPLYYIIVIFSFWDKVIILRYDFIKLSKELSHFSSNRTAPFKVLFINMILLWFQLDPNFDSPLRLGRH